MNLEDILNIFSMQKTPYGYFKRDVSWLSFNYRVLMEAADDSLPVYERIKLGA